LNAIAHLVFAGICWLYLALACLPLSAAVEEANSERPTILAVQLSGVIGPATADLIIKTLEDAAEQNAVLVVIELDTPGGLDKSMRLMIKEVIASPVPVATFVFPSGSRAASAGTYLLYASHVAAMAPATNLGAASPVQLGSPGMPAQPPAKPATSKEKSDKDGQAEGAPPDNATTLRMKVMNDAVAYIKGLAELHGRNAEWAEKAVREAASIDANEALELQVIDYVAQDLTDLLAQLDGQTVTVNKRDLVLLTKGTAVEHVVPGWRYEFLLIITNPNVAYILMMIGIYGLLLEFYNPGVGVPGVVGGICLLVALYAFQLLPVSYIGLALIILGIALMSVEALSPSFGIFGFGGVAAFAIGSVMLMDSDLPGYQIATPLIAAFVVFSLLISVLVLAMLMRSRKADVVSGDALLIGQQALVVESNHERGRVRIQGEIWNAVCDHPLNEGEWVTIRQLDGLTLRVEHSGDKPR